jgi:glycerol-3-phosphate dehydrogenase (NAD(P)+)
MSEVICDEIRGADIAVISGPSHAEEVCKQLPTAAVVAGNEEAFIKTVQEIFHSSYFRIYTNSDIIGVELAGALKNVIAIACGVSDGLGFGDNTKAALMTRGLAEIGRLGRPMGADPHTFAGLAGVGDLIATCTSLHSRNRNLGEALAKRKPLETALKELNMVAEGVPTTISAVELGKKFSVELPITGEVYAILFKNKSPGRAVKDLLSREAGTEWR